MVATASIDAIRADFVEKIGLLKQSEGLPRIAGRVLGLLIFDGEAVSFGDLSTKLQVSRGSISSSIRLLEERGLIKRIAKPGDRQDYFQLAPNPYVTMLEVLQKRSRAACNDVGQTIAALPQDNDALPRLEEFAAFYASTDAAIDMAISKLATPRMTQQGQTPKAPQDQDNDN